MSAGAACPTPVELDELVRGALPREERDRARFHVETCDACARRLDEMREELATRHVARGVTVPGSESDGPPVELAQVPGFDVQGELHRGAQGVVYRAIQLATKRTVALKVLLTGAPTSEAQRLRFVREVDLAASLDHPNVVPIYESGVSGGQPWFAMKLIDGPDLEAWALESRSSLEERLGLFIKICAAVGHAHQRGVIHRDLKPSNVRVDSEGEPHVLDFGLAKATGEGLSSDRELTATGLFLGTLAYASPEQARGAGAAVDVRSDVYALGVMLFELLTGRLPHDVDGDIRDVLTRIQEEAPARPRAIAPWIDDELETIVLRAIAKDPDRRYQSVEALETDVERYLAGEPIEAKRDSRWYVLRKTLRRYRVPVAAISIAIAGLVVALAVIASQASRARAAEEQARAEAERARQDAETARQVTRFLSGLFEASHPQVAEGEVLTVRHMLEVASKSLGGELADEPRVRADLLDTFGRVRIGLGEAAEARVALEEALRLRRELAVEDPARLAGTLDLMAHLEGNSGNMDTAVAHAREAVKLRRLDPSKRHALASALHTLGLLLAGYGQYEEGRFHLAGAVEMQEREAVHGDPDLAYMRRDLASVLGQMGRFAEAEALLEASLADTRDSHGESSTEVADVLMRLASVQVAQARIDDAGRSLESALEIRRRVLPPDHPDLANVLVSHGEMLVRTGDLVGAEELLREALDIQRRSLGPGHPGLVVGLRDLAHVRADRGDLDGAEAALSEASEIARAAGDSGRDSLGQLLTTWATVRADGKDFTGAVRLAQEAVPITRESRGPTHHLTAFSLQVVGQLLSRAGRHEEAEAPLREALAVMRAALGPAHPRVASVLGDLAHQRAAMGDAAGAITLQRESAAIARGVAREQPALAADEILALGRWLLRGGELEAAEEALREASGLASSPGVPAVTLIEARANLVAVLARQGRCDEAARLHREVTTELAGVETRAIRRDDVQDAIGGAELELARCGA